MSNIIGSVSTSHIPAIGAAIARGVTEEAYWKPFFDAFPPARTWLTARKPDVVVVYNDHGLNFFLDKMPTFAIGAAAEYRSEDEGWGIPPQKATRGIPELSWAIIEQVVEDEFDVTTCQEMLVDHACTVPLQLLWPEGWDDIRIVPVAINTVQHPLPSAARCLKFGQSIGKALRAYKEDLNILVASTGGLSHQLEGERAGFLNPHFDDLCLNALINKPELLTKYTTHEIVELAGSQGAEILNWIVGRGVMGGEAREVLRNYHIPISNTAAALQVLEPV